MGVGDGRLQSIRDKNHGWGIVRTFIALSIGASSGNLVQGVI
jgi:hypothetical protein